MKNYDWQAVSWYVPNRKRPIAFSTVGSNNLIVALSKQYNTIQDVHDAINYDMDAKAVLLEYINRGFGDEIARQWFS